MTLAWAFFLVTKWCVFVFRSLMIEGGAVAGTFVPGSAFVVVGLSVVA